MSDYPAIRATLAGPCADLVVASWMQLAQEHTSTGAYAAATNFSRMIDYGGNPLAIAVANTSPHARVLEDGHGSFHMPERVDWSGPKVKVSKKGRRYLVIPFRHGTPGTEGVGSGRARTMMPTDVYRSAMTLFSNSRASNAAKIAARGRIDAAGTQMSRPYGLKGFPAALRERAMKQEGQPGYTWRNRTYEGLTRHEQKSAGGKSSGSYFTFRVMTEDSVGWFQPAFPGYHIAARVVDMVKEQLRDLVSEAARDDVVELVRIQVGEAA